MFKKLLAHPAVQIALSGLILAGVLLCVFPGVLPRFSWVVNHAVQLMLFYLAAGLIMLFFKQPRLTFAFFAGCVLLCFFLKFSVKGDGIERWRKQLLQSQWKGSDSSTPVITDLKVAHINLTNANSRQEISDIMKATDADIYSLHELTPDWEQWLSDSLDIVHPYQHTMVDLSIYGMAIYSKYNLVTVDTFFYNEAPNLISSINKEKHLINLISVHTQPALDEYSKQRLKEHLISVENKVISTGEPVLVVGDFNAVSWSEQVQTFMDRTGLMESRSGFMPNSFSGKISFWEIPLDHIFYSGEFVCSSFQNIIGETGQHLGIMGTYQFATRTNHAEEQTK